MAQGPTPSSSQAGAGSSARLWRLVVVALGLGRVRFWAAALGIALGALLVLSLAAAYRSADLGVADYVKQPGADFWVAPPGSDNIVRASGVLPMALREPLRRTPGVAAADPVWRGFLNVASGPDEDTDARRFTLLAFAYVAPGGLGGPPRIVAGSAPAREDELALDRAAAYRLGVGLGGRVWVGSHPCTVTALTDGTNLLVTQLVFGNFEALALAQGAAGTASFFIVRALPGADRAVLARALRERVPQAAVHDAAAFLRNNQRELAAGYVAMLALVYGIGLAAAGTVVGLLVHDLTEERRSELAVLLALGAHERRLWWALLWQAMRLSLTGVAAGTALALLLRLLLDRFYPVIPLHFGSADVIRLAVLFGGAGAVAAALPLMRLRRIDPLEAFRP